MDATDSSDNGSGGADGDTSPEHDAPDNGNANYQTGSVGAGTDADSSTPEDGTTAGIETASDGAGESSPVGDEEEIVPVEVGKILFYLIPIALVLLLCAWSLFIRSNVRKRQQMLLKTKSESVVIEGVAGMYEGTEINIIKGEEIFIGRDSTQANIIINEGAEKISRKHCGILYDESKMCYRVTDYSTNGTFNRNGIRFLANVPVIVPKGTVIVLGNKQNQFRLK